ncbi:MAG TPA: cysteine dioxygenase [Alphaproteobacteria bacterium]|jgi:predicted metal-dependent enzyme (double-stranded beta helix superfamily)
MDREIERASAIKEAVADIRAIEAEHGVTKQALERMKARLIKLAARTDLFTPTDYPAPPADSERTSTLYRIAEDDDHRFALYANAARAGVRSPAHNHTVWAVIVGISGEELNRFYERAPEGVRQTGSAVVRQGTGVAFLPDDLHSIHIDAPALNLHMYGKGLEQLHRREYWKDEEKCWKVFPAHSDIREARVR